MKKLEIYRDEKLVKTLTLENNRSIEFPDMGSVKEWDAAFEEDWIPEGPCLVEATLGRDHIWTSKKTGVVMRYHLVECENRKEY